LQKRKATTSQGKKMSIFIILISRLGSKLNGIFIIFEKRRKKEERKEQNTLIVLICSLSSSLTRERKKKKERKENLSILIILIGSLGPKLNGLFIIFLDSLSVGHDSFIS